MKTINQIHLNEEKIIGVGDLLDKEKIIRYIRKKYCVTRFRALNIFNKLKMEENKRIPDVQKAMAEAFRDEE